MKALLLAAGMGTRLRPLTNVLPKCLVPIQGRPLLSLWLEMLTHAGIDEIFVNLCYKRDLVQDYVLSSPYRDNVKFLVEEELLDTAGTLLAFKDEIDADDLLIAHADNLTVFDMKEFIARFESRPEDCGMTMMTFDTPTPESCGIVQIDAQNKVTSFVEKPREPVGTLANAAVYIAHIPAVMESIKGETGIKNFSTQILPRFVGKMNSYHNDIYHRDIGTVESLSLAQNEVVHVPAFAPLLAAIPPYRETIPPTLRADFEDSLKQAGITLELA